MLNDFFQISDLKSEPGQIRCVVRFHAGHELFQGHFPNQPVVPGVCSMALVKNLLEAAVGGPLLLQRSGNVKFLQLLLPHNEPEVSIAFEQKETGIQANATFTLEEKAVFKVSGFYVQQINAPDITA